jgi:hypothetical protein
MGGGPGLRVSSKLQALPSARRQPSKSFVPARTQAHDLRSGPDRPGRPPPPPPPSPLPRPRSARRAPRVRRARRPLGPPPPPPPSLPPPAAPCHAAPPSPPAPPSCAHCLTPNATPQHSGPSAHRPAPSGLGARRPGALAPGARPPSAAHRAPCAASPSPYPPQPAAGGAGEARTPGHSKIAFIRHQAAVIAPSTRRSRARARGTVRSPWERKTPDFSLVSRSVGTQGSCSVCFWHAGNAGTQLARHPARALGWKIASHGGPGHRRHCPSSRCPGGAGRRRQAGTGPFSASHHWRGGGRGARGAAGACEGCGPPGELSSSSRFAVKCRPEWLAAPGAARRHPRGAERASRERHGRISPPRAGGRAPNGPGRAAHAESPSASNQIRARPAARAFRARSRH